MKILPAPKLKKLKTVLTQHKRIAIFMHNNPDPDALASAMILRAIATHFKIKSDIILNGSPNQAENHTMIRLLKIPLKQASTYDPNKQTLSALVDCQRSMKNHSIPPHSSLGINFDHHKEKPTSNQKSAEFKMIQPHVGATASLLMQTFLSFKLPVTSTLATAYAYALLSETRYLSREFTPYDIDIYKSIVPSVNFNIIAEIQNTRRPLDFYKVMKRALSCYHFENGILTCQLGTLSDLAFVHQIAEELIRMEGIDLAIVTGYMRGKQTSPLGKISLRGERPDLELGKWLKEAMEPYGSGGGHRSIAAGNFTGSEARVMKHVKQTFTQKMQRSSKKK